MTAFRYAPLLPETSFPRTSTCGWATARTELPRAYTTTITTICMLSYGEPSAFACTAPPIPKKYTHGAHCKRYIPTEESTTRAKKPQPTGQIQVRMRRHKHRSKMSRPKSALLRPNRLWPRANPALKKNWKRQN